MKYLIANFKSHKIRSEVIDWMGSIQKHFAEFAPLKQTLRVVICPPFPNLADASDILDKDEDNANVVLGVQDISPFPAGSYTGAVSTRNLEGFKVGFAIVGHSERRHYFHETNTMIALKVSQALNSQITPIVCVGTDDIENQANAIDASERNKVIVAFEPIDHIGTGRPDSIEHILSARDRVMVAFGNVPFLYGGSITIDANRDLLANKDLDGFLVGGASLNPHEFTSLVKEVVHTLSG